ncbi:MAG: peptide chain release factor N(5)-glutamine methyltransferase [Candidatus Promineofilum sp.]|nr:peptide chain release factor N(5)-glutamine methyltransferase [Promineifilum sp.]MBP9656247.1 peptide chain release factor N(5)-glutamine methyltransferase [Promineifilum sp.]
MPTIREAWQIGRAQLSESPTPALDARLLLELVLGHDHAWLVAHDDEPLAADTTAIYRALLDRAAAHEPIPYLTGHAPFLGLDFAVSHDVLIPRPETEQLVEMAAEWADGRGAIRVVDVGTGSGCIAVSLARRLPRASVAAVDISAEALAVATVNARHHAPDRIRFVRGDLLAAFAPGLDLIVANLPYIAEHEWPSLAIGVKFYEPALALNGGVDGLDHYRNLLPQAAERLRTGGLILLEIGWRQGEAVMALARQSWPEADIRVQIDFAGRDRIVVIQT